MSSTFQKIPFLRITLAFALGIVGGKFWELNSVVLLTVLLLLLGLAFLFYKKYTYKKEALFGFIVLLLFILLGQFVFLQKNTKLHFYTSGTALATVLEKPQQKTKSYKSQLRINAVFNNGSTQKHNEQVLVYFAKTDAAKLLEAGDQILIKSIPQKVINTATPYTFNYKNYLNNKGIYRQLYLSEKEWLVTCKQTKSAIIFAEQIREKLRKIYQNQNLGEVQTQILSALTLGYKRDLDPETKRVFSAAGAMHVLAVSGLHVGIVFMVFSFLFGFLRKHKVGSLVFMVSAIFILWFYAFITGLSPSVLRAATMFSILIIGTNMQRRTSIYNSLAVSALLLLLFNPNNLFEVGFQLSYSAVFGIVFLQPRLVKLWPVKNKFIRFFWILFTVSLAAQIATFPLTAFYFNQFPFYFWLSNFIVIPAASLLIPLGIALLAFAKVPMLSTVLAVMLKSIVSVVYTSLHFIETLPWSLINNALYPIEFVVLCFVIFLLFLFIANRQVRYLKGALLAIFILFSTVLANNFLARKNTEIIVYNDSNTCVHLIDGRNNYVISRHKIEPANFLFGQIESLTRKKRLREPLFLTSNEKFEDSALLLENGLLAFKGRTMVLDDAEKAKSLAANYLLLSKNYDGEMLHELKKTTVISTRNLIALQENKNFYNLKNKGAFVQKW